MKKERTGKEYAAIARALEKELLQEPHEVLAQRLALKMVYELMQEELDALHQPAIDQHKKEVEKLEARNEKLRDSIEEGQREHITYIYSKLRDAPKQLARHGAQARAATAQCLFEKKIEFLSQQHDIFHTEGLARRLDREFGIKGRQPEEDEPASRGAKDVVRDWNKFRSVSKTEETDQLTHQEARRDS